MSQVNLLPPDIIQGQRVRRITLMILLAGLAIVSVVFAFYLLQVQRLSSVNDDIDAQEATNAQIQAEIDSLVRFEDLQVQAQESVSLLHAAYQGEVSFSGLLMDLSRVTPSDSYLDSVAISMTGEQPAEGEDATTTAGFVGTISMSGQTLGIDTVSIWLTRLDQVEGWVNAWVPSVALAEESIDSYTFSATVDLTTDVVTARGRG